MIDKKEIKSACLSIINDKLNMLQKAINESQSSANNESKSSAGDKHETSRAMAQIENERLTKQLHKQLALKEALSKISIDNSGVKIQLGSYVQTSGGDFYISVGLGKVNTTFTTFFATPMHAPVGRELIGKETNSTFSFNGNTHVIKSVI